MRTRDTSLRSGEFGDFQTPLELARAVCQAVRRTGLRPASIVEPTCGRGSFLQAAVEAFPEVVRVVGVDANAAHVDAARQALRASSVSSSSRASPRAEVSIERGCFFSFDWRAALTALPRPLLVLGNPPWVTNSALGSLGSENRPARRNLDGLRGIEALTGKSNFDVSEWMLRESLDWIAADREGQGALAVLCKTSVARKVLLCAWKAGYPLGSCSLRRIDARESFGVRVDACLLMIGMGGPAAAQRCGDYPSLAAAAPSRWLGLREGELVSDLESWDRWSALRARSAPGWRSGVKHDCSALFELARAGERFTNGLREPVAIEPERVFPLLKGSDLARGRAPARWLVLPQLRVSEDPGALRVSAPALWAYLCAHGERLDRRASSIYRRRPRFSIFGVGPYSFAPWKVAISGLHKSLRFSLVGPHEGRPVLFDDTCYFLPCASEPEARAALELLQSEPAAQFLGARAFWDAKRPITAGLLNSLDLSALARMHPRQEPPSEGELPWQ